MACSCSSASFTSFAGGSPSTCASSSSSSSATTSLSFLHHQRQLPGSKRALLRLDCERNATQRLYLAAAAKQGQGQYDKAKKPTHKGGDRNAGVAVKEGKPSSKGGGTGGKNPKSYNRNPNTKSYESSNSRSYGSNRSASMLRNKEEDEDDDDDEDGDGSHRNPRPYTNISNTSRNSTSHNTSTSSRGGKSLRVFSDEDEDDEEDGRRRSSRLSASNSSGNSRLSNTTSSSGKGRSRLHMLHDEEEDTEDEDVFDEEEVASDDGDDYAELPIMPIPPAGFVLAEDGSVSIVAPPQKRITTLMDQESKSPLDCLIRRVFSSADGRQCFLLCPLDTPVQILRVDDGEVLKEISDEELEDVFPTASYELAKRRLHLVQSGYCLTLRGGFCYSDDEVIDLDTVYGESGEGDRSLNEGVEVASFLLNDSEYLIFTPVDPLMFVTYKDNKTGELLIADDDLLEDEAVLDAIDEEKEFQAYMEEDNLMFEEEEEE